jgi:protein-serine/threonine kinase
MKKRNKVNRVLTEREILATTNHPFIVTLYYSFQSQKCLYFVMSYCSGGAFFNMLQTRPQKCLTEKEAKFYAAEVLLGLEYLHMMGFIYRDLKPENILIHETGHIMLTDFDLSKHCLSQATIVEHIMKTTVSVEPKGMTNSFVGTPEYVAPEVINGQGHTSAVDWWTYGVLIFEMLFGTTPFKGTDNDDTFNHIIHAKLKFPEHKISPVSSDCKGLIKKLLRPDYKKRLGSENGAADIKASKFFKDINWSLIRNLTPPIIPPVEHMDLNAAKPLEKDLPEYCEDDQQPLHSETQTTVQDEFSQFTQLIIHENKQ